jgi:hypothetical protein
LSPAYRLEVQPGLTSLSPNSSYVGGSKNMTINGSGFISGYSQILENSIPIAGAWVFTGNTAIAYTLQRTTPGVSVITVQNGNLPPPAPLNFNYTSTPSVSIISRTPSWVRADAAGSVDVYGSYFNTLASVKNGTTDLAYTVTDAQNATVTVPARFLASDAFNQNPVANIAQNQYQIAFSNSAGSVPFYIENVANPVLTWVSHASIQVGQTLTLSGTGFYTNSALGATTVRISGVLATANVIAHNTITAVVPPNVVDDDADVYVTNRGVLNSNVFGLAVTPAVAVATLTSVTPAGTTYLYGGNTINCVGTNFLSTATVRLSVTVGGTTYVHFPARTDSLASSTALSFTAPDWYGTYTNAGYTVTVSVTNPGAATSNSRTYSVTAVPPITVNISTTAASGMDTRNPPWTIVSEYVQVNSTGGKQSAVVYSVELQSGDNIAEAPSNGWTETDPEFIGVKATRGYYNFTDEGTLAGTYKWKVTDGIQTAYSTNFTLSVTLELPVVVLIPNVISISPTTAWVGGGQTITVTGENFTNGTQLILVDPSAEGSRTFVGTYVDSTTMRFVTNALATNSARGITIQARNTNGTGVGYATLTTQVSPTISITLSGLSFTGEVEASENANGGIVPDTAAADSARFYISGGWPSATKTITVSNPVPNGYTWFENASGIYTHQLTAHADYNAYGTKTVQTTVTVSDGVVSATSAEITTVISIIDAGLIEGV